ncbi:hypothetical protein GCM10010302_05330 [Streptomyces polychromogenes]|uniref:Uncharacterized protein n=1 Tax=Streptomyces polychromogenes TaxID=67342 RepID=A0ABP3EMY0_9ACTN
MEPDELPRLGLAAVDPHIDRDVLARQIAGEEQQCRALEDVVDRWGTAGGEQSWAAAFSARPTSWWAAMNRTHGRQCG